MRRHSRTSGVRAGRLAQRLSDERGSGLIVVLGVTMVMSLLVTGVLSYATNATRQSGVGRDRQNALAAAEAGVDDYLYRLNRDDLYWLTPDATNSAFTDWVAVPGAVSDSFYRYEVDASQVRVTGNLILRSHGAVGAEIRTIDVQLRREGFLDFLYFTEYETIDPVAYRTFRGLTGQAAIDEANLRCAAHRYDGRAADCADIYWFGGAARRDIVDGPFHTNDTVAVSGSPLWLREATTSLPEAFTPRYFDRDGGTSTPTFSASATNIPEYRAPLTMPPSNTQLRAEADFSIGGLGCLYTGPTRIRLSGAQLEVTSPLTNVTGAGCVTNGTMPIPANGVIYVQNAPTSGPNARTTCPASGHPLGYPQPLDVTSYGCLDGDVFVEGILDGRLTIGAENNIVITWDITMAGGTGPSSDDVLGLIANNFVETYHPVSCTHFPSGPQPIVTYNIAECETYVNPAGRTISAFSDNLKPPGRNRAMIDPRIQAAIVSVRHSFRVQNFRLGAPMQTLHLTGAIAQIFRGPVSTFDGPNTVSGYAKDYVYDDRLAYLSPPHFLGALNAAWKRLSFAEEAPGIVLGAPAGTRHAPPP